MKIKELIELLKILDPEAKVVIHRDAANYGFGRLARIGFGTYEPTDYGNEFFEDRTSVISMDQIKAICFFPEDYDVTPTDESEENHD